MEEAWPAVITIFFSRIPRETVPLGLRPGVGTPRYDFALSLSSSSPTASGLFQAPLQIVTRRVTYFWLSASYGTVHDPEEQYTLSLQTRSILSLLLLGWPSFHHGLHPDTPKETIVQRVYMPLIIAKYINFLLSFTYYHDTSP